MSIISPSKRFTCLLFVILITFIMPSAWPLSRGWTSNRAFAFDAPTATPRPAAPTQRARIADAFARLPLRFEANSNPRYPAATFSARASGYSLWVAPTEAVLELALPEAAAPRSGDRLTALHMQMLGANPAARVGGREELVGKSNYFVGSDASKWRTNIATYAGVAVENIYPGVEVVYYGQGRELEYDFKLAVGADYKVIGMRFEGARGVRVDEAGELVMETAAGQIRQHKPVAYQLIDGARHEVAASYVVNSKREVGFKLAGYDASKPLVIDPVLSYSRYLHLSNSDSIQGIAVDAAGNAYITGYAFTGLTRKTLGNEVFALTGPADLLVYKFDPTGSLVLYSTFLSGGISETDREDIFHQGYGIAVDAAGNAYVTGATGANNYPTTPGAFQSSLQGLISAVVTKLNPTGNLLYSTYLGGSNNLRGGAGKGVNAGRAIAVDATGNAYVTGLTDATNFPTLNPVQSQNQGGFCDAGDVLFPCTSEAFVTKLNPTGTALIYSTYLGGSAIDSGNAIALDAAGNAYIAGSTFATNFPTANAVQSAANLNGDAFVAKLNAAGNTLIYSTYLGGGGSDVANGLAVDGAGSAYVTGTTTSTDFPTTLGSFQPASANTSVFKSGNGGSVWQAATTGIPGNLTVASLQVDPKNSATLYAVTTRGIYKSTDSGSRWKPLGFNGNFLAIDPSNPSTLYSSAFLVPAGEFIFRSTNGGITWSIIGAQQIAGRITGLAVDPQDSAILYASLLFAFPGPPGIHKSTDGGLTWQLANRGMDSASATLVAVNPRKPARVFAATNLGTLFRSKNRAKKWSRVFNGSILAIVFDPKKAARMYVGTSSGVFKSGDGGSTWNPTGLSGHITSLAIDPVTPATLYAAHLFAGDQSVLKSTDGGDSWSPSNNGLSDKQIATLAVDPQTPSTVYAAGGGGGADAFVTKLDPTGAALVYSTYLGGEGDEGGFGIAVDASGNAYITGKTKSIHFPMLNSLGFERRGLGNFYDAFITKLDAAGAGLAYSTTFGGSRDDIGLCIALDSAGGVYVAGTTASEDLPATNPSPVPLGNIQYAFIAKIKE